MFILSCTPRVFIISSTVDKLCGFQLSRVETCQKRSHPGNGFHLGHTPTQDLWEDHCGGYFIVTKNMAWRMCLHFRLGITPTMAFMPTWSLSKKGSRFWPGDNPVATFGPPNQRFYAVCPVRPDVDMLLYFGLYQEHLKYFKKGSSFCIFCFSKAKD